MQFEGVDVNPELPLDIEVVEPMRGIHKWRNPQNGFTVYRLGHEANPIYTDEFLHEVRKGMSFLDFLREYLLVWRAFSGKPVYIEDWSTDRHSTTDIIPYNPNLPIVRGWDFGLTPACVFAQLVEDMRLNILSELCEDSMGVEKFLMEVNNHSQRLYPKATHFVDIVDPSGFYRGDTDERSCVAIMSAEPYHLRPIPGIQNPISRRNAVIKFLQRSAKDKPAFSVCRQRCPMIMKGFDGGFHFTRNRSGQWREMWEKNEYSHPHEALQYICTRVTSLSSSHDEPLDIKRQTYGGFSHSSREKRTPVGY